VNNTTIIQVPTTKSFRNEMAKIATDMGFSSLQDLIRFSLTQIKNKLLVPTMASAYPDVKLTTKNNRRYSKIIDDIDSGKEITLKFNNNRDMFNYLNDPNRTSP
jgi:hypothetical protein